MKVKKIISSVLALAMMPAVFSAEAVAAKYEGVPAQFPWGTYKIVYNTGNTKWDMDKDYATISSTEGYNGSAGMVFNVGSSLEANRYMDLSTRKLNAVMTSGNTYRLSYKIKGSGGNFPILTGTNERYHYSNMTKEDLGNGWTYCYTDATLTANRDSIHFFLEENMNYVIDDLSVKQVIDGQPSGTELIINGDFETYNPGEKLEWENERTVSSSWKYHRNGNCTDTVNYIMKPTRKYARTGNYGMYFKFGGTYASNAFMFAYPATNPKSPITSAADYVIEFYAKGGVMDLNNARVGYNCTGSPENTAWVRFTNMEISEPDADGWRKYSYTLDGDTIVESNWFWIFAENRAEFAVDDVKFYSTANPDVNLISDGGFENSYEEDILNSTIESNVWNTHKSGATATDATNYFMKPTNKLARSGDYSMYFHFGGGYASNAWMMKNVNPGPSVTVTDDADYVLEAYINGYVSNPKHLRIGYNITDGNFKNLTSWVYLSDMTKGETDANGWTKYTYTFDGSTIKGNSWFWIMLENTASFAIDDLKLYSTAAPEKNLINDGGFENNDDSTVAETEAVNLMSYATINSSRTGYGVNISWTNPNNDKIENIKVYLKGAEVYQAPLNLSANAFNQVYVRGTTSATEYDVKVVMQIDGKNYETAIKAPATTNAQTYEIDGWKVDRFNAMNGNYPIHSNFNVSVDNNVKYTGDASLKMQINRPTEISGLYPNVSQNVRFTTDSEYLLTFAAKTENISDFKVMLQKSSGDTVVTSPELISINGTNNWALYEVTLNADEVADTNFFDYDSQTEYDASLMFCADAGTGNVWIDDVELYEYSWGEKVGSNLISTGGFEKFVVEDAEFVLVTEDGSKELTALEAGNVEVTAKIANYSMGADFNAAVIVALYNGNKLESVTLMERAVVESSQEIPADEFTAKVTVPDLSTGDYMIKVMYWNGTGTMTPLKDTCDILVPAE